MATSCEIKCGGSIIWKSRLGGWMTWVFDIQTEVEEGFYLGGLQGGYFESTLDVNGSPYIPVNYTNTGISYLKNLKDLSLANSELDAVRGIAGSMAVYFVKKGGELELMRVDSVEVPKSSVASGGDFSISLTSISNLNLNVR